MLILFINTVQKHVIGPTAYSCITLIISLLQAKNNELKEELKHPGPCDETSQKLARQVLTVK